MCCLSDTLLAGTVCLGGISTATTTTLQYTGHIDDWRAVVIPSVATFVAIMGCVLRCACRAQTQTSVNHQRSTIIINHHNRDPITQRSSVRDASHKVVELREAVAIPVGNVEPSSQPSVSLENADMVKHIHNQWRKSQGI